MSGYKYIYMENKKGNHYKFYEMKQISDTEWQAKWGPIGSWEKTKINPMFDNKNGWHKKLSEKLSSRKGYEIVTERIFRPEEQVRQEFVEKLYRLRTAVAYGGGSEVAEVLEIITNYEKTGVLLRETKERCNTLFRMYKAFAT